MYSTLTVMQRAEEYLQKNADRPISRVLVAKAVGATTEQISTAVSRLKKAGAPVVYPQRGYLQYMTPRPPAEQAETAIEGPSPLLAVAPAETQPTLEEPPKTLEYHLIGSPAGRVIAKDQHGDLYLIERFRPSG